MGDNSTFDAYGPGVSSRRAPANPYFSHYAKKGREAGNRLRESIPFLGTMSKKLSQQKQRALAQEHDPLYAKEVQGTCLHTNVSHFKFDATQCIYYLAGFITSIVIVSVGTGQQYLRVRSTYDTDLQFARPWKAEALITAALGLEFIVYLFQLFTCLCPWHAINVENKFPTSIYFSFPITGSVLTGVLCATVGLNDVFQLMPLGVLFASGLLMMAVSEKRGEEGLPWATLLYNENVREETRAQFQEAQQDAEDQAWFYKMILFIAGAFLSLLPYICMLVVFTKHTGYTNVAIQASAIGGFSIVCLHHGIRGLLNFANYPGETVYYVNSILKFIFITYLTVSLSAGSFANYADVSA